MNVAAMDNAALDRLALIADRKRLFVLYAELDESASKSWLVHNMLGCGEVSAFYGAPGCGKGVLIEDMGLHIAAGLPWHSRAVTRGTVVYIALERKKLVERRAIAFRKKHGLDDLPFAIVGGVYDFRLAATAEQIVEIYRAVERETGEDVVLVIVDTLSRALCGGDENSPKDMGAIVTTTATVQERIGAHVLWVHHMPHEGDRMRGHGALLGAVDTTLHISKNGELRSARVVKANDSEEGETVSFTIESVEVGADGTTAPIAVPTEGPAIQASSERKISQRQQLALNALAETVLSEGQPAPAAFGLPQGVMVVSLESWKQEMHARDVIESADKNPRATFKRLKEALAARGLIGIRQEKVWLA